MVSTTLFKDAHWNLNGTAAQSATTASTKAVRVSIDRGDVYLGDTPVRLWMLQSERCPRASTDSSVLVVADRGTPTEQSSLRWSINAVWGGAASVGVMTDRESSSFQGDDETN